MQNVYRILDNIFYKASNMEELKSNKSLLILLQDYLNQLNSKLFTNIINGQKVLIENTNYITQMNKISNLNVHLLEFEYNSQENNKNKYKKTKIRYLQNNLVHEDCKESVAAFCISQSNITNIIENTGSNGIGFQGQINNNQNLPIEEKQFSNSIYFSIFSEGKNSSNKIRN